ncbi:MAG: protein translocase subunit SecD [Pseudomonadota bacterium]|nr:protein translocase subunit SecD [Pseudomonadota bacterium]
MNRYPLWKNLLILAVLTLGLVYALPNLYGDNPALQVNPVRAAPIDSGLEGRIADALKGAGLKPLALERDARSILVRFADTERQLKAKEVVAGALGDDYVVALNLASATPAWLRAIGAEPMFLGLDLRGGVHFLMEVDMQAAGRMVEERFVSDLRSLLRENKLRYKTVAREEDGGILLTFRDADGRSKAAAIIGEEAPDLSAAEEDQGTDPALRLTVKPEYLKEQRKLALQQNLTTLRNRVNELGVAEPIIQQQGEGRIVVQLPGVQDTARAKEILGATATLEFRMVHEDGDPEAAAAGRVPVGAKLYRNRKGEPVLLKRQVMLTGDRIVDAASGIDQTEGQPAVFITLDGKGARIFSRATKDNVGRPMAVVFIENKVDTKTVGGQTVKVKRTVEEVINVATIREQLSKRFQITGLDSTEEARNLALLLRAGSLAAPIDIVEERTIGPSLGQDNIEKGVRGATVGFVLVLIFAGVYYGVFGLVADLALLFNLVLLIALMSLLQATLTLPGIAGIVLSVAMAVDANVLIFERIREELRSRNTPQASINAGYEKAFATILDSNTTTLIAGIVLFAFGTGPVKGFAVTLSLGILTSMFTAVSGTRAVINVMYGGRRLARLAV